jgi:hypothetical protein
MPGIRNVEYSVKVSQSERNISAIQREELFEKAGIRNRYQKLDFAQGIFSRVELLRTQESTENMQDPYIYYILNRCLT